MANNVQHVLDVLEVNKKQAKDALRSVVHTILFNRALGPVTPREMTSNSFPDVSFVTCADTNVEKTVEEAIERFCESLRIVGPDLVKGEMIVSFYDMKKRPGFLGLGGPVEEKVYWERWVLPLVVNQGSMETMTSSSTLRMYLFNVLAMASEIKHIPRFRASPEQPCVYRYDITISKDKTSESFINRVLANGPPVSLRFSAT